MIITIMEFLGNDIRFEIGEYTIVGEVVSLLYQMIKAIQKDVSFDEYIRAAEFYLDSTKISNSDRLMSHPITQQTKFSIVTGLEDYLAENIIRQEDLSGFICSIGMEIFLEPVKLPCGKVAEKDRIERWVNQHHNCPFCREALTLENLVADDVTKRAVEIFINSFNYNDVFLEKIKSKQYSPTRSVLTFVSSEIDSEFSTVINSTIPESQIPTQSTQFRFTLRNHGENAAQFEREQETLAVPVLAAHPVEICPQGYHEYQASPTDYPIYPGLYPSSYQYQYVSWGEYSPHLILYPQVYSLHLASPVYVYPNNFPAAEEDNGAVTRGLTRSGARNRSNTYSPNFGR